VLALRTSTATYLPLSDHATIASMLGVGGDDERAPAAALGVVPRGEQHTQLVAVPWGRVLAAGAERRRDRLDLVRRRAISSRRIVETESPFLSTMVRSFQALRRSPGRWSWAAG